MASSNKSESLGKGSSLRDEERSSRVSIQIPIRSQGSAMPPPPVPSAQQQRPSSRKRAPSASNHDSDPNSQSGQRKRHSIGESPSTSDVSSKFSERIKRQIKSENPDGKCWHCGGEGKDVAHVMPGRQNRRFEVLKRAGLTSLSSLNQKENGFFLCKLCHDAFDELPCPDWTFFPTDLKFFIREERRDFQRRVGIYKGSSYGPIPPRQSPTASAYFQHQKDTHSLLFPGARWGKYTSHVIEPFGPAGREFSKGHSMTKIWHGDPLIALRHSFAALPEYFPDLPEELRALNDAYRINDRKIGGLAVDPTVAIDDFDDDDDDGNDGDDGPKHGGGSPDKDKGPKKGAPGNSPVSNRHSARIEERQKEKGHKQRERPSKPNEALVMLSPFGKPMMQDEPYAKTVPCKRPYDSVYGGKWAFGPKATAQSAIDSYSYLSRHDSNEDESSAKRTATIRERTRLEQGLLSPRQSW